MLAPLDQEAHYKRVEDFPHVGWVRAWTGTWLPGFKSRSFHLLALCSQVIALASLFWK